MGTYPTTGPGSADTALDYEAMKGNEHDHDECIRLPDADRVGDSSFGAPVPQVGPGTSQQPARDRDRIGTQTAVNPRVEANLRLISLVISRVAADLLPEFAEFSRSLYEARPAIGLAVWTERRRRGETREQYAAAHNLPVSEVVRIERWRLI